MQEQILVVFSFLVGASVGSFLNVCIYRLPRDLSVNKPKRSFCPQCKYEIPVHQNLPILSWLLLRGKCASCGKGISPRYLGVELLTGLLFLAAWLCFSPALAVVLWVFIALLVVATFIDFEHMIIPDSVTIGGAVAGLVGAFVVPPLMGGYFSTWWPGAWMDRLESLGWSAMGAVAGYALLWGVVMLGKLAFGKIKVELEKPAAWKIREDKESGDIVFECGEDLFYWQEVFFRPGDCLVVEAEKLKVNEKKLGKARLRVFEKEIEVDGKRTSMEEVKVLQGTTTGYVVPREAMGMGDVKFMALIGAFTGWKGVLFTVFGASFYGLAAALAAMLVGRRDLARKIPFGPYLAMAAMTWVFFGPQIVDWYWNLARG